MPEANNNSWEVLVRLTLGRLDESLLRDVAQRLVRPRNLWPVEELIDRCLETLANPVLIDRRLKDMDESRGQLLAVLARSTQRKWKLGQLVEIAMTLGQQDGLAPVFELLGTGFLIPDLVRVEQAEMLPPACKKPFIKTFEQWLGFPGPEGLALLVPPLVVERARSLPLPAAFGPVEGMGPDVVPMGHVNRVDGVEILLRLAVLTQIARVNPPRINQQGGFFKRDLDRFRSDALLAGNPADALTEVPDFGVFIAELAEKTGLLQRVDGELRPSCFPLSWEEGQVQALAEIWSSLILLENWTPCEGLKENLQNGANPFPTACYLGMVFLGNLPETQWVNPEWLEIWLLEHHPYWADRESVRPSRMKGWLRTFLLGVAYQLSLVEAVKIPDGSMCVRLSQVGRAVLGLEKPDTSAPHFPKTLLVQPNLEILAYRQGLTPALISGLTRLALWKTIGPACQLVLDPDSVYHALETGMRHEEICSLLERHGTRAIPQAVLDNLKTWANKHERIAIYTSATLLEFPSPGDLDNALSRGLPAVRVSDRFAIAISEEGIDFSHYRLTATRDYGLTPEKCVRVEEDGVTLVEDVTRSDLVLETELPKFSDFDPVASTQQARVFKLTPESLKRGIKSGFSVQSLEDWFQQRLGHSIPPATRLILGAESADFYSRLESMLVIHVSTEEMADGLTQWPETAPWIHSRLGPKALAVNPVHLEKLKEGMALAGHSLQE